METKRCTKCGEVKGLEEFYKLKTSKDGHNFSCKVCRSKINRASFLKNKDKAYEAQRRWRVANQERAKQIVKTAKTKGRAKALETMNKWRGLNAERIKAYRIRSCEALVDRYVKQTIGVASASPELIEMKRQQLLAHRALKEFQKLLKEQTK